MENLIDSQHGVAVLLVSIVVVLALQLVARVGEFLFNFYKEKRAEDSQEITKIDLSLTQNTQVMRELRIQVQQLERELGDVHKLNADIQKLFSALKFMAGKKWTEVKKAMEEDAIPK